MCTAATGEGRGRSLPVSAELWQGTGFSASTLIVAGTASTGRYGTLRRDRGRSSGRVSCG